jgi:phenylalanyl-tRNA synthetase alpha chain
VHHSNGAGILSVTIMNYQYESVAKTAELLKKRLSDLKDANDILKSTELKSLYEELKLLSNEKRASFGQDVNALRNELRDLIESEQTESIEVTAIDVTAPFDSNVTANMRPSLLNTSEGTQHPLTKELNIVLDIFYRMGFTAIESREIDDDYHMFETLNFAEGHPARDDYDTFMTVQTDGNGKPFIAPAHTSTMQHRVLKEFRPCLESGKPIAVLLPGRVFRNEDLDPRHEHTFYQFEGVYVDRGINAGNLLATFKTFLGEYYGQEVEIKSQPFYFPFTEPSFELALSCPFCDKQGCTICSHTGWIELLGMGMIHPNVLDQAGIDTNVYTGFAWGCGLERLVMMKYGVEDIRNFESGRLDFLRQFA